jgi:hypothetical protein
MNCLFNYNFNDVVLNELLLALQVLREGKIKVFKKLFYVRQEATSQLAASYNNNHNLLEKFIINDVFHNFNNFIISENLVNQEKDRINILKGFAVFIGQWCINSREYKNISYIEKQQGVFKNILKRSNLINKCLILFKNYFITSGQNKIIKIPFVENYILKSKL